MKTGVGRGMGKTLKFLKGPFSGSAPDPSSILNALTAPVITLDGENTIRHANAAAEQLFESSLAYLSALPFTEIVPADSPIFTLIRQVRQSEAGISQYDVTLDTPRTGRRIMTIQVAPLAEMKDWVVVALLEQTIALKIGNQLTHRSAARSVTAMASLLAHEVKNPLSGIRGAAQLLEQNASLEDKALTRLICDEADRIVALVDRMEAFSDKRPLEREAVNIHRVLEHVRRVAENGFAKRVRFIERYDPSLPPVLGNRDQLVQVFLNLVKNAAEAAGDEGGEVILTTGYRHGMRVALPGGAARVELPLMVAVQDNGCGIPEDLRSMLFDPFVTTKPKGSGLGLALVAKVINDHGGVVECESQDRRTVFRVMLPIAEEHDDGRDTRPETA